MVLALLLAAGAFALLRDDGPVTAEPPGAPTQATGAEVVRFTLSSEAVGAELSTSVIVPDGARGRGRPLLVFLHGLGGSDLSFTANPALLDALAGLGPRAPVVAFPDGGTSFWYDRPSGDWDTYVLREVIPAVARRAGADPHRVAVGGISMGGFGALDVAGLNRGRFCAVAGHSPAIWTTGGETAEGAFDDAEDFARHDVVAAASSRASWAGARLWIDAGDADPFQPGVQAFLATLREAGAPVTERTWPGGHEGSYWNEHWRDYARFYARALSNCR